MQFTSGDSFGTKLSLLCKFPPLVAGSWLCLGTMVGTSASLGADSLSLQGPSALSLAKCLLQKGAWARGSWLYMDPPDLFFEVELEAS